MKNDEAMEKIKAFGMTNQMLMEDLSRIGSKYSIELGHAQPSDAKVEAVYYPQFDVAVRKEAAEMARHYELFYCREKSIRALVSQQIEATEKTEDWWPTSRVPSKIQEDVKARIQRERETGMTRRSTDELDYTNFGELSVIIINNWDVFGSLLDNRKAVEKIMSSLNSLRGPIAHCSPLAEDEVLRLQLTMRDWFRLME
jgi:hypothetical protein